MSRKSKAFLNLADAAGVLQDLKSSLKQSTVPADAKPQRASDDFADMAREMQAREKQKTVVRDVSASAHRPPIKGHAIGPSTKRDDDRRKPRRKGKGSKKSGAKVAPRPAASPAGRQTILKGIRKADAIEIYKTLEAEASKAVPTPVAPSMADGSSPPIDSAADFQKVIAAVANARPVIEPRPSRIAEDQRNTVERKVNEGARHISERPIPDMDGYIMGLDFGTSSLKLAVRQPYVADDPTKAMPVPETLRSFIHPYLWQTVVWYNPGTDRFSLCPSDGAFALDGFKTGIISSHEGERVLRNLPITRVEAATAFMAMQLAHAFGWYGLERPLGHVGADQFLAVNIGIPVAAQDDRRSFSIFRRIVATAFELAPFAGDLSHSHIRQTYNQAQAILPEGFNLIPELTAAIAGYAFEPTSQHGSHMLIDVGASTLDIVAFNLVNRERIAVFAAGVELLGAAALDIALKMGLTKESFKRACDQEFEAVYGHARSPARAPDGFHPVFRRRPVQLLITGGGSRTKVHKLFINEMPTENCLGLAPLLRPIPPEGMTDLACDRSRLLLAYGLTRDVPELLELKLPSQVSDITPPDRPQPTYIGPEMI